MLVGLTFHDLRREGVSRLFKSTDSTDLEIASTSGRRSMQTLARYTHLRATGWLFGWMACAAVTVQESEPEPIG